MEREARRGSIDIARSDLISWSSIVAGVPSAFGLFVLLSGVALAAGLEADSPRFGREVGLIIGGPFLVLAFLVGGFIAAWTADVDEPESAIMQLPGLGGVRRAAAPAGRGRRRHRARLGQQCIQRGLHAR